MDKSFVTLEQKVCQICGKPYDTNSILLDTRLRNRFDYHTMTGIGPPCQECDKQLEGGTRIALVVADEKQSVIKENKIRPEDAYRTGEICWLRRSVWDNLFDVPCPNLPMVFIDKRVFNMLYELQKETE